MRSVIILPLILAAASMTAACGAPLAVTGASYAADGGLLLASDKTSTDHLISMVSKQDCALWRVVKGRAVCKPRVGDQDPYDVDYGDPQRMVAEDGVHYAPPLRPAAEAPATSWDAAAYKVAPTDPAPRPAPVTAVATAVGSAATTVVQGSNDASPVPVAEPPRPAPSPTAAKAKRPKANAVKKPSRNRAAPAS